MPVDSRALKIFLNLISRTISVTWISRVNFFVIPLYFTLSLLTCLRKIQVLCVLLQGYVCSLVHMSTQIRDCATLVRAYGTFSAYPAYNKFFIGHNIDIVFLTAICSYLFSFSFLFVLFFVNFTFYCSIACYVSR